MQGARFLFLLSVLGFTSCSTAPRVGEFTSREMMEAACPANFQSGRGSIKGSVWTKISSKEMTGQFPASVAVDYPHRLALEVTNLIGAPQAWLKIEDGKTELRFSAENEKEYGKPPRARAMLGGLPLELAPRLFAGGVPCPSDDKNRDIRVRSNDEGGLDVEELDLRSRVTTHYSYNFMRYAGKPWVKEIRWEKLAKGGRRGAKSNLITFTRDEPMDPDGAPKKWGAVSGMGEVQVRWKDRAVTPVMK